MSDDSAMDKRSKAAIAAYGSTAKADLRPVMPGCGSEAQQVINRAKEAGIFVHEDPDLLELLAQLDFDQRIPPRLYRAVAEVTLWARSLVPSSPEEGAEGDSADEHDEIDDS